MNLRKTAWQPFVLLLVAACGSEEPPALPTAETGVVEPRPTASANPTLDGLRREFLNNYLAQIETDFNAVETTLAALQGQVSAFLEMPDAGSLNRVRASWLATHEAWERTAVHRYFAGLMFSAAQGLRLLDLQYRVDHWPILPGYVDYVGGYAETGIVNDATVVLDIENLRQQHGAFAADEAALGFHVLEFLLWGENRDAASQRPVLDYSRAAPTSQSESGGLANNRRRRLLALTTTALLEDVEAHRLLWTQGRAAFADDLNHFSGAELLALMTRALTTMLNAELLERSLYPLLNGQYHESAHAPFSHSSASALTAQLDGVAWLLPDTLPNPVWDPAFATLAADFQESFQAAFASARQCLVSLYESPEIMRGGELSSEAEFAIVECINLASVMIDHLEQIGTALSDATDQ